MIDWQGQIKKTSFLIVFLLLIGQVFLPQNLDARPGGGHTYKSSGQNKQPSDPHTTSEEDDIYISNSKGDYNYEYNESGETKDEDVLGEETLLFFLLLPKGAQMSTVIIVFLIVILYHFFKELLFPKDGYVVSSGYTYSKASSARKTKKKAIEKTVEVENLNKKALKELQAADPAFSEAIFLDFVSLLYSKYYSYLQTPRAKELGPFISKRIKTPRNKLVKSGPKSEVVVGHIQIASVGQDRKSTLINVDIKANYNDHRNGQTYRHIIEERWTFERDAGLKSLDSKLLISLACPNCGGPNDFNDSVECGHCKEVIRGGEMTWVLEEIMLKEHQHFKTDSLGTYTEEAGTDNVTLIDKKLNKIEKVFCAKYQIEDFDAYWKSFEDNVVYATFMAMYEAWATRDNWASVRHFMSDRLYESNNYWIKNYQEKGYFNVLENIKIEKIILVKIDTNQHYDTLTVRIIASAIDYTIDGATKKVVGGDRKNPRRFTEYWTFIRKSGVEKEPSAFNIAECPSCGAPADKMNDHVVCGYCEAKANLGDFSWILTAITQDEDYRG